MNDRLFQTEGVLTEVHRRDQQGISGLSCAWLLSRGHLVTLGEAADRLGGHSHTAEATVGQRTIAVDTGFIAYNEKTYPNLTALFACLDAPTAAAEMSFSASLDHSAFEYAGGDLRGLLARPVNLIRPRCWRMLGDLLRCHRNARRDLPAMGAMNLGGLSRRQRPPRRIPVRPSVSDSG